MKSSTNMTAILMCSRQGVMDYITLQLAPRAADELVFGRDQVGGCITSSVFVLCARCVMQIKVRNEKVCKLKKVAVLSLEGN